jgi:ankyrin repeat protein/L-ascorbate metabolism protein UlaG (beta-lactamase superfamily)
VNNGKKHLSVIMSLALCLVLSYAAEIHDAVNNSDVVQIGALLDEDPALLNLRDGIGMTPLNTAAFNGNEEIVTLLLNRGADVKIGDVDNSQPIHLAAISGNTRVAELLLANGATANEQDDNGATPLIFATGRGHLDMVRYLIENGADVNLPNVGGMTPLFFAGISEVAAALVDNGGNINAQSNDGTTPLHSAVWRGRTEVVRFLLEKGANPNLRNEDAMTPLFAVHGENAPQIARLLIENGAQVNIRNNENSTPLHIIASTGSVELAELLLSKGADINVMTDFGWTPLCMATMCNAEITDYLLSKGASVNPHEYEKKEGFPCAGFQTPLHCAIRSDSINTVRVLVDKGALVNITDDNGMTPLHLAVNNCNLEITDYLIKQGARLNLKDEKYGRTELHTAVIMGQKDIAERLIKEGAKANIPDNDGNNPLDYARYHGFHNITELLERQNAKAKKYPSIAPNILSKKIKENEAVVWYLGHSGWAIKTQNHLLIFDYFERPNRVLPMDASLASGFVIPSEIIGENVTVFVSHHHGDHYDPRIFEWRNEIPDIEYVFGFQPDDIDQEYIFTPPRSEREVEGINIYTIRSNDAGVGFLIDVDGLTILHPGDHANGSMDMSASYTAEIDALTTMTEDIDLAFFAILGCSLGTPESVKLGVHYAIEQLKPKVLLPMHAGHASYFYREFVEETLEKNYATQLAYALNEGERFFFTEGKLNKVE